MEEKKNWRPYWSYKYSPEELLRESIEYFTNCDNTKVINGYWKEITKPKTMTWLALWLWVAKDYVIEKIKDPTYSEMIKYIRGNIENDLEEWAMTGKYNPAIVAKNLWANFWWVDKQEIDQKTEHSWSIGWILSEIQWL